jgi:hypothetical protein
MVRWSSYLYKYPSWIDILAYCTDRFTDVTAIVARPMEVAWVLSSRYKVCMWSGWATIVISSWMATRCASGAVAAQVGEQRQIRGAQAGHLAAPPLRRGWATRPRLVRPPADWRAYRMPKTQGGVVTVCGPPARDRGPGDALERVFKVYAHKHVVFVQRKFRYGEHIQQRPAT